MRLERILETVLYYSSGQEEELAQFYGEVLGLRAVGRSGLTFRVGEGLLLLFDASLSSGQSRPPPHGARGPIHTCFVARADEYGDWKQPLTEAGAILQEIEWDNGVSNGTTASGRSTSTTPPGMCWRLPTATSGRRARRLVIVHAVVDDALSPARSRPRGVHPPRRGREVHRGGSR